MNYPIDGMRQSYWKRKNQAANIDDEDLADLGYSPEEIAEIKKA